MSKSTDKNNMKDFTDGSDELRREAAKRGIFGIGDENNLLKKNPKEALKLINNSDKYFDKIIKHDEDFKGKDLIPFRSLNG